MTDHDLAVAAWGEFSATTDSYPTWVKKGRPASSHWAKGKAFLDQIGVAPPPPSGLPMPVGDIPGWHQLFADDFLHDVPLSQFPAYPTIGVNGLWTAYGEGWKDTSKNGTYSPSRGLSIHDSVLDVFLHTDTNGDHVVNTPVPILPGRPVWDPMVGGRFMARWKFDPVPGYKVAWLLWPSTDTNIDGEIDFPETDLVAGATAMAFMHHSNGTSGGDQDAYDSHVVAVDGKWHTTVTEWLPAKQTCAFYLDDVLVGESTSRVPTVGMSWRIQCETNLNVATPPAASAQGHLLLDWVAIYSPT